MYARALGRAAIRDRSREIGRPLMSLSVTVAKLLAVPAAALLGGIGSTDRQHSVPSNPSEFGPHKIVAEYNTSSRTASGNALKHGREAIAGCRDG
jgi:hypothetical protein